MRTNYRKICKEHNGYNDDEMKDMDVHHIDGNHQNNDPTNLLLISPEEHAKIHAHEFVAWARRGHAESRIALRKRIKEKGLTDKELASRRSNQKMAAAARIGTKHTPESIEKMSAILSDGRRKNEKHNRWGMSTYKITSPDGEEFIISGGFTKWCSNKGINPSNLREVATGNSRKHASGWKAVKLI